METKEKESKKQRLLILLLLLLLLLAVGTCVWALFLRESTPPAPAPPEVEDSAQPVEGDPQPVESDSTAPPEPSSGGGTVSLTYSDTVSIDLSKKEVTLLFADPAKSAWDAAVRLVIQDVAAAQSDTLSPGQQVTVLPLSAGAEATLSAGSCEGKLLVSFYDRQNGEEAMLNTEIPVTVTVTE